MRAVRRRGPGATGDFGAREPRVKPDPTRSRRTRRSSRRSRPAGMLAFVLAGSCLLGADPPPSGQVVKVLNVQNRVEIIWALSQERDPATPGQVLRPGDRGQTYSGSRVMLQLFDRSVMRIQENSVFTILQPPAAGQKAGFELFKGLAYFFSREKPMEIQVRTRSAVAAVYGTEFALQQDEDGRTVLSLWDGEVTLSNLEGESVRLRGSEQGLIEPGRPPRKTPLLQTANVIQWFLYYPGVLDLDEVPFSPEERQALAASLEAWRQGDILQAVSTYPAGREAASPAEKIYQAALALAVNNVDRASALLDAVERSGEARIVPLAVALRKVIAAVRNQAAPAGLPEGRGFRSPTERLAESYLLQSRARLAEARSAAWEAVTLSTNFAFGWARVAELEFSHGHLRAARTALDRSLALAPRNAQALALMGFLRAAENRIPEARQWFEKAIAADGALANAWLGRGLCRIRTGQVEAGRADLQTAAALEPERSFLRSYLGKAWSEARRPDLAARELALAKKLDANDPTPWLYSALLAREENRINEAVADLEESVRLNHNRRVYRSAFLLDQDLAVRSSSLANLYQSAGLTEVSLREAVRAVSSDYGNYSGHLFLSESYDALRDPTRFNLRYETPWFSEWLLATLLSPVGGTPLAQHISQEEYVRFFNRDRLGLVSQTEYRSDGIVREVASQYGHYRNVGYAVDLDYQYNQGVRPNNQLDRLELYGTIKYQLTEQDSLLFLTEIQNYHSGDNFQYYRQTEARPDFHYNEYQTPGALVGGYHREWAPGIHTLLLGGRLANDQRLGDVNATNYVAVRDFNNAIVYLPGAGFDVNYRGEFETYSGEICQILQGSRHALVLGARYQTGTFTTTDEMLLSSGSSGWSNLFPNPPAAGTVQAGFERVTGYGYWTWEILPRLLVTPGLTYDSIRYPQNFRHPPVAAGQESKDQFGPKAALVWNPRPEVTLRGAYTRSLGGVSYDESYRLEPTQLAGFLQSFRSLMPESLVGSVSAPQFETGGVGLDLKFRSRTYVLLQAEWLRSEVDQTIGMFDSPIVPFFATPSSMKENLDYRERALSLTINQLLSREWSFGLGYKFTRAELERTLPEVPLTVYGGAKREDQGDLHRASLFVLYNHPSGWFAQAGLSWYIQDSSVLTYPGGTPSRTSIPGEEFPQLDLLAGYRFKNQRGEIALGVLNLTGEDYHLNPINLYQELPRERVFYARLRLRF